MLAFLAAIAKPAVDLWNNLIDPGKKRERMRLDILAKIRSLDDLRCYCEDVIRKTKNAAKKTRFERRLAECVVAISRLRDDLKNYK